MRIATCCALLLAVAAQAQGPRLAIHPLELREMTGVDQEVVRAQFDVLLARISGIRLAGSSAVEDAILNATEQDCETRDECLRAFAAATESLYAVHARIRPDPLGAELLVNARVVRADGTVMRTAALAGALPPEGELASAARQLLVRMLEQLDLETLSPTVAVIPVAPLQPAQPPGPPAFLAAPPAASASARRPIGFALLGGGVATVATGCVLAGLAVDGRSKLALDASGAVPRVESFGALAAARESQAATVIIPVGAVLIAVGAALAWWPSP